MISLETFLFGLLVTSILTGLATEAVKQVFIELSINYKANTLAGIVSLILSVGIGVGYVIFNNIEFTSKIIVCIVTQMFLSWLCAMVGYDKVIQAISQFKSKK